MQNWTNNTFVKVHDKEQQKMCKLTKNECLSSLNPINKKQITQSKSNFLPEIGGMDF